MATNPLGSLGIAQGEFGDGAGSLHYITAAGLALSYQVQSPGSAISISFVAQAPLASALPLIYWIVPNTVTFTINGSPFPSPHRVDYKLPGAVGTDLSGISVKQGYSSIIWSYEVMLDDHMQQLMELYDPKNPLVTITYPNELGIWVQKLAMMQPPNLGTRQTVEHRGVSVTFTHVSSD